MFVLITGGSGSGKSAYGEGRILSFGEGRRIYIATMHPYDEESLRRVDRHRRMRAGKGFETVERYTGLSELVLPSDSVVLLECLSNLVANEMFQEEGAKEETVKEIWEGIQKLKKQARDLVVVTNEIFSEAASYEGDTKRYEQYLGELNQKLAAEADEVVEVVYGIPVFHKKAKEADQ